MRDYEEKSYYEIQLDNKQLILVFLAGVTVCVLVFILGVMVGKGKKEAEMASISRNEMTPVKPQQDLSQPQEIQPAADDSAPKEKGARKNKQDKADASEKSKPAPDAGNSMAYNDLDKSDSEAPLTPQPVPEKKTAAKPPAPDTAKPAATQQNAAQNLSDVADRTQEPSGSAAPAQATPAPPKNGQEPAIKPGNHFTVQVMATGSKEKATQQLNYLKNKGYTAFMTEEKTGSGASVFKVRVGKFADSDSAKKVATRLKQELKLETWVAVLE